MAENLTPKQRKAGETLLTSGDVSKAAAAAGVSRETLYKWLKQSAFSNAIREAESEALESLSRALVSLGEKAAAALGGILEDSGALDSSKLRAAEIVLSNLMRLRELVEIEKRIDILEKRL